MSHRPVSSSMRDTKQSVITVDVLDESNRMFPPTVPHRIWDGLGLIIDLELGSILLMVYRVFSMRFRVVL